MEKVIEEFSDKINDFFAEMDKDIRTIAYGKELRKIRIALRKHLNYVKKAWL